MHFSYQVSALSVASLIASKLSHVAALPPCPLLGPGYPKPTDFSSSSSTIPVAWQSLTSEIDSRAKTHNTSDGFDWISHSFSIGSFSIHDVDAQNMLQYHHTGSSVINSALGTNKVDENSVYRVASLSKLITAYLTMLELGSTFWETSVIELLPELALTNTTTVPGTQIDWQTITIGTLMGHMSGIGRDISYFITDLAVGDKLAGVDTTKLGVPPLNHSSTNDYPSCIIFSNTSCPKSTLLQQVTQKSPVYQPWTYPSYSNLGFMLLGAVLEHIKSKPYETTLQDRIFDPLNMTSSSSLTPAHWRTANTVIPGSDPSSDLWGHDLGIEAAAEGIYSTLSDINKLGVSILNSTLLEPVETRKWLKPISHTANLRSSVGRPWEIYRVAQPVTGRVDDLYTKAGNFRNYSSILVLSPDHEAGLTVLVAGPQAFQGIRIIQDVVGEVLVPAWEAQAAVEAKTRYAGCYQSDDRNMNSSMTIMVDPPTGPGLIITSWISNGTDMMQTIGNSYGLKDLDARMYPTDVGSDGYATFRAVYGSTTAKASTGIFSEIDDCQAWEEPDALQYGRRGVDEMVFEVDGNGRAQAISPTALRTRLVRIG